MEKLCTMAGNSRHDFNKIFKIHNVKIWSNNQMSSCSYVIETINPYNYDKLDHSRGTM